jgi:hypothetical protein
LTRQPLTSPRSDGSQTNRASLTCCH